jgi:hypothetical protein
MADRNSHRFNSDGTGFRTLGKSDSRNRRPDLLNSRSTCERSESSNDLAAGRGARRIATRPRMRVVSRRSCPPGNETSLSHADESCCVTVGSRSVARLTSTVCWPVLRSEAIVERRRSVNSALETRNCEKQQSEDPTLFSDVELSGIPPMASQRSESAAGANATHVGLPNLHRGSRLRHFHPLPSPGSPGYGEDLSVASTDRELRN